MSNSPFRTESSSADELHLPALFAAALAALVGAVIWAGLAWLTGYEVGYVAWGIGFLVGMAATKFGGRGVTLAAVAATLTIVAIFAGKFMGTQLTIENEFDLVRDEQFSAALYEEIKIDARAWDSMQPSPSEVEVRRFMLDHGFGGLDGSGEVQPQELQDFTAYSVPIMEQLTADNPRFEDWQERVFGEYRAEVMADLSMVSLVIDNLSPIDLLFAFLAVSTAFSMVKRASGPDNHGTVHQRSSVSREHRRAA